MKHVFCIAIVLLLCVGNVQAADVPFVELKGHKEWVNFATFSPDGEKTITASWDGTTRIWDTKSGKELQKFQERADLLGTDRFRDGTAPEGGHYGGGGDNYASMSPDGKKIVTACVAFVAEIWDVESGKKLRHLSGHSGSIVSANFSPCGKKIVTASIDSTIRMWDAESGEQLQILARTKGWSGESAVFSPDGKKIAIAGRHGTAARILDAESGKELVELPSGMVYSAMFSSDGKKIVTAGDDHTARIWDTESRKELQKLAGPSGRVFAAAFSPDGQKVVTAGWDKTVRIWDANTGEILRTLSGHTDWVLAVAFSPCGKKIVSAGKDNTARIWILEP